MMWHILSNHFQNVQDVMLDIKFNHKWIFFPTFLNEINKIFDTNKHFT
jgi:hypothetical protein